MRQASTTWNLWLPMAQVRGRLIFVLEFVLAVLVYKQDRACGKCTSD